MDDRVSNPGPLSPLHGGEMADRVRAHDWSATSLGPAENWSERLKSSVEFVLASDFPTVLLWGPDLVQVYNDAYREIMGPKHPAGLGAPKRFSWAEVWEIKEPIYRRVLGGETVTLEEMPLLVSRGGDAQHRWFTLSSVPVRDQNGSVAGALTTVFEVTAQREAESVRRAADRARRENEERFRAIADLVPDLLWSNDPEGRPTWMSRRWLEFTGLALDRDDGYGWTKVIHPEDVESSLRAFQAAMADGSPLLLEHRMRRHDGAFRWFLVRAEPTRDETGRISQWFGSATDIHDQRTALEALWRSEERQRQFARASTNVLWIRDVRTLELVYQNAAFARVFGIDPDRATSDTLQVWLDMILPEDRAEARASLDRVRAGERLTFEYRIRRPADGQVRWMRSSAFAILDGSGGVFRVGGIDQDITCEREAMHRMEIMVAELQHRTRNLIALIASLASQTARSSGSLPDFIPQFRDRLGALSRVQGLLSRSEQEPITIGALLELELQAIGADLQEGRIEVRGPELMLPASMVQTFALAIHELATNARKYGALRPPEGGHLTVRWQVTSAADDRRAVLEWIETGVEVPPETRAVGRKGYGRELIERALPYALGATTRFDLTEAGVHCCIEVPISGR